MSFEIKSSCAIQAGPKSKDNILIGDGKRHREKGRKPCEDEAEIRVLQPLAKEGVEPLEGAKGKHFSLEISEEVWPCLHLDFRLLASRTVKEYFLKLPSL